MLGVTSFRCAASFQQLTKEKSLSLVSHFDSDVASSSLATNAANRGATHMSYVMVVLVLSTLFGLDAYEAALAIFIAAFLIHLCR